MPRYAECRRGNVCLCVCVCVFLSSTVHTVERCAQRARASGKDTAIQLVRKSCTICYNALGSDYVTRQIEQVDFFSFRRLHFFLVVLKIDFRMTQTFYEVSAFIAQTHTHTDTYPHLLTHSYTWDKDRRHQEGKMTRSIDLDVCVCVCVPTAADEWIKSMRYWAR